MEIGSQEQAPQAQSKMAGDGAGGSSKRMQLEAQLVASLGEERVTTPLSFTTGSSSSSNSGEADSEGDGEGEVDSTSDPEANTEASLALARYMYSPLDGDSDSDLDLDDVELFCDEALALLAHEMVCCDCESDLELEEEEESEEMESEELESESDPANDHGQDNLSHNTYQLMFSEEDEEESLKEENAQVESVLLLGEDQESEEKSDPKSGDSFINASPGCL